MFALPIGQSSFRIHVDRCEHSPHIFVCFAWKSYTINHREKASFWLKGHQQRRNIWQASEILYKTPFQVSCEHVCVSCLSRSINPCINKLSTLEDEDVQFQFAREDMKKYLFLCKAVNCKISQYLRHVASVTYYKIIGSTLEVDFCAMYILDKNTPICPVWSQSFGGWYFLLF